MSNRINLGRVIGATGEQGEQGLQGVAGQDGLTPYISGGTWWLGNYNTGVIAKGNEWLYGTEVPTTQGNDGDLYLKTDTCDVYKKTSGVWGLVASIKGDKGDKGEQGDTALTVTIGQVTTVESNVPASVTNVGTNQDLVLNFSIPKGSKGDKGDQGERGNTNVYVGGNLVDNLAFDRNPQTQLNEKMQGIYDVSNAGKFMKVNSQGVVEPYILDLSGYAERDNAVGSFQLSVDQTTYVITLQAKDVDGNNLGNPQTIDLPLESVVVSGSYDSQTKKIILTLENGSTIEFSVADLVSGLQSEITSQNKLSADLVDDTNALNKFVSTTEKNTWNGKQDELQYDNVPTQDSIKMVKSGGIYSFVVGKIDDAVAYVEKTYNIGVGDWSDVSNVEPFKKGVTIVSTSTIGLRTEVELINDNALEFANYGFAIGSISGQNITIYALKVPATVVVLKIRYREM